MKSFLLLISIIPYFSFFAQHLPLQIGNQWHYDWVTGWSNYAAIAVEQVSINDKEYFKIERRHYNTGELLSATYDRLDGDSAYYRLINDEDKLIINFNWPEGYTRVTPIDTSCISIHLLSRVQTNIFGFNTEKYNFWYGHWCEGMGDTLWALTPSAITSMFGSQWEFDGHLTGVVIDGQSYGTLHPLPVELISFSSSVDKNKVSLQWFTSTETNNSGFEIERLKLPDQNWSKIGFANGNGTTTETKSYSFIDNDIPFGKYKYRLKQIDFDGTFEYSNIVDADILMPGEFILYQNFPNPFNPSTTISWQQPAFSNVTIKIFDVLGTEIKTLINEEFEAGSYKVDFNASELSNGIYFYTLQAGNSLETKKLILLK